MKERTITFKLTQEKYDKLMLLLHEWRKLDDDAIEIAKDLYLQETSSPSDEPLTLIHLQKGIQAIKDMATTQETRGKIPSGGNSERV